ncbi:hypothetical protein CCUS01_15459 [Colletotrichum cuscutae]|uniref:Uncharacterized protein n=1 Tax=Colletotrichum cuscutae TaxID=1209917 RepID=A0AAI9VEW5_9PEZI|nr:hypothetical protein CCUS01_15459 [Colletotrichum cuscutae]
MHVIDEATGDPPTLSTRRRAVVVFLKSLDLAMNLRAYQDRGRVESGQVRITRTLQQNGSLLEIVERRCTIQKGSISSDISTGARHVLRWTVYGQIEFTRPEGAWQDSSPRTPELRSRVAG